MCLGTSRIANQERVDLHPAALVEGGVEDMATASGIFVGIVICIGVCVQPHIVNSLLLAREVNHVMCPCRITFDL